MSQRKPYIDLDNPALNFITMPEDKTDPAEPIQDAKKPAPKKKPGRPKKTIKPAEEKDIIPEGYKLNPQYIEKKTRRLQLVLQPSLYEKVKAEAQRSGKSVNDLIHSILEESL